MSGTAQKGTALGDEVRALLRIGAPMMVAQGGLMAMGVVDTFMIGRVSSADMAAVALGNGVAGILVVFGVGVGMGIEPLVAQAHGAGEPRRARSWLGQGIWTAAIMALPLCLLTALSVWALDTVGIDPSIIAPAGAYLWARVLGIGFNCIYAPYRSYLTAIGVTRPILLAVVLANIANAGLDAWFLFGLDMGAMGVGLATSLCWILMIFVAGLAEYYAAGKVRVDLKPDVQRIKKIFSLGLPIGLHFSLEVGVFAAVSVLIGRLGAVQLAGHQIAISLASFVFMVAVGVAVAATARVGFHVGAGSLEMAKTTGALSMLLGAMLMGSGGAIFLFLGAPLSQFFAPTDPQAQAVGVELLKIAAAFSICDGVQVVAAGALRGAGDTRSPFIANAIGHWIVGLPAGVGLVLWFDLGAEGYWWGLTIGLTFVAVALGIHFFRQLKNGVTRLE